MDTISSENFALTEPFFGKVEPLHEKMLAEDKRHETCNLPKAYEGKNKHLEKARLPHHRINKDVLSWFNDDPSVKWEIFRFNKTLMDLVSIKASAM